MANIFQKAIAKATFWDKSDDQRVAQDDEEDRRKKKQQAAAQAQVRSSTPAPGTIIQPNPAGITTPKLSDQVGSQSQFGTTNNKIDFTKPLVPAKKPALNPDEQIEKRTQELIPEKQKQQGDSFLDRNLLHRGAATSRATVQARNQALREYQDANGYDKQPEVQRALAENKTALGKLSDQDAKFAKTVNTISKGADKVGAVAQYVPVTGSVLNLGLAGADAATGHQDKDIANTRSKLDFGMTKEEFDALPKAQQDKLQNIREIGLAASPLDFTGVGGLAKSEAAVAAKKGVVQLAKREAIDEAMKQAIKQGLKSTVKKGAVATVAGTTISAAGQQYLTGDVDPLEALKSGALIGGTSLLVPDKPAKKLNRDVINAAEDLTSPEAIGAGTTGLVAAKSVLDASTEAAKEGATVPGRSANGAKAPEVPTTEIAPGVKVPSPQEDTNAGYTPPKTVGDALDQADQGIYGADSTGALDADLRVARTPVDTPEEAALDVPTFMRNQADEKAKVAQQSIDTIDQRLAGVQTSPQVQDFQDKQAIAAAYRESPTKGKAMERYIAARNQRNDPEATRTSMVGERAIATQDLSAARNAQAARDTLNVPDPSSPIALAPVDEGRPSAAVPDDGANMADFNNAIAAPLRPAVDPSAAPIETGPATADVQGNPALQSDATATQSGELTPSQTPSVLPQVSPEDQMTKAAAATADAQVQTSGETPAAPRTYDRLMEQVSDPNLRAELANEVPGFDSINIASEEADARKLIGSMTDEDLIATYRNGVDINSPQGFFQAIPLLNRLGRTDVLEQSPEARDIVDKITTQVALKKSSAGQTLRSSQVLFENMPPVMKRETLLKSLGKAGDDMPNEDRDLFLRLIERSDDADQEVSGLQQEAQSLIDDLQKNPGALNGEQAPGFQLRIDELHDKMDRAKEEAGATTADAVKFYDTFKPKPAAGSQIADVGRSLMLSGIGGRVFDNLSTAQTAINDVAQSNASAAVGKLVNKVAGDGRTVDTFMSPKALAKGTVQGAKEVVDSFRGKGREETSLESFTKNGDPNRSGVAGKSGFRGFVNNVVDIPTKLSKGIETARQEQLGRQEARQLGLSGDEENLYAQLRSLAPTDQQKHDAVQLHMRTNNLHENFVTDKLNQFTRVLSASKLGKENPRLAGAVDVLIKNQVAPFTSFLGGNLHRALTDKNILFNVTKAAYDLKKGNLQGFADQIGNLGVNTTQAMAGGYLLSSMGILTDKDANGNDYGGVYIHLGDRYIPAAVLGAASVPVIFGNAVQSSMKDGESPEDVITKTIGRATSNTFASAGVASVFGGENNLMQTVDTVARGNGDAVADPLTKYGSGLLRQYVNPAIFGDVNAAANNGLPFGLNPNADGTAPQINVTKENADGRDVANVQATEGNRILAGIPGISQTLDRDESGKQAPDLLDRGLKSTREGGDQKQAREKTENLADVEKQLKKDKISTKDDDLKAYLNDGEYEKAQRVLDYKIKEEKSSDDPSESKIKKLQDQKTQADLGAEGVSVTDDGIKARTEDGDYDKAMKGLQYQLDKSKDDKNVPASTRKKTEDQITRLKVAQDKNYKPETIALYDKTSTSEWRAMGDSKSADYDPDTYNLLAQYDADLAANGVSASTKDGSKQKFYNTGSGSGSGGSKGKGVSTDIALQSFEKNGGLTPIKGRAINFDDAQSEIPTLTPVKNYDQSKKKKITVSGG